MIKIWFEKFLLNDIHFEFLLAQIEAFEKYLKRASGISAGRKNGYLNGLKLIKKMAQTKTQMKINSEWKERMLNNLEVEKPLLGKIWLNQKIKDL